MRTRVFPIDWREEFAELGPFLKGRGGVARVRYAGEHSAPSVFLDTLKSEYEFKDTNTDWRSIRIDHEVYSVRYLHGIRDEFIRKIGLPLPKAYGVTETSACLGVLTDLEAGGDINADVSNITLNHYSSGDNPAILSEARDNWIRALCDQIAKFLTAGGHLMVVVNHGKREAQDEFWRYVWRDGLERLVVFGLMLVHMIDGSDSTTQIHQLAPHPQVEVNLPMALGVSAQGQAVEDLTRLILREVPKFCPEQARAVAHALVSTHEGDIPRLHRHCVAYVMNLAQGCG